MPEISESALAAAVDRAFAAEAGYARTRKPDGRGHSMPPRDQVSRMIAAAAPILADVIASAILRYADEHEPPPGSSGYLAWHRHSEASSRVAARAFGRDNLEQAVNPSAPAGTTRETDDAPA